LAKKSFEKLREHSAVLLAALSNGESSQVRLTARQFVMITKFVRGERGPLYHVSILHPKTEVDMLVDTADCYHSKTINMRKEEFVKLHDAMDKLHLVITTPPPPADNASTPEEEVTIKAYKWDLPKRGTKSLTVYPSKDECQESVKAYVEGLPSSEDCAYEIEEILVHRSSKMEILEHVFSSRILDKTGHSWSDLMLQSPEYATLEAAIAKVTKTEVVQIAEQLAVKLNHKRLYFMNDVYDIFVYFGGVQRVTDRLRQSIVTPSLLSAQQLMEFCYRKIVRSFDVPK